MANYYFPRRVAIALLLLLSACAGSRPSAAQARKELGAMLVTDQSIRSGMEDIRKKHGNDSEEMKEAWRKQRPIDEANLARLEANVDARRRSMGLEPLSEYAKFFGLEYPPR